MRIASPIDPGGIFNRFGWTMRMGTNDQGIFVSAIAPFDRIIRPVLIPWEESMIVDQPYIGTSQPELIATKVPEVQLIITSATAKSLREEEKAIRARLLTDSWVSGAAAEPPSDVETEGNGSQLGSGNRKSGKNN